MSDLMLDPWDYFIEEAIPYHGKIKKQQQQPNQQAQSQIKPQDKSKTQQKVKSKSKSRTKQPTTSQQSLKQDLFNEIKAILTGQKRPQESKLFEDINKEREQVEKDLQSVRQEYNMKLKELAEFTNKFNDAHSKMIGLFALMLGKSDLAKHTNEHLFDKMRELVLYYPVDVVPLAMRSLVTGYFAGKQAGIDTDGMSVGELITMGENPEFVSKLSPKSLEFLGQLIDAMPQIFQMKVAPYKIMLDKLQNEAKILEAKQTHQENMLNKLLQLEQIRLGKLATVANVLSLFEYREGQIQVKREKLALDKAKGKEKQETSNIMAPEIQKALQDLFSK
jgi:hypothetical protein